MCDDGPIRDPTSLPRRRVLLAGATAAGASLAGCLGQPDGRSATEPVDPVPDDAECAVCKMKPAEFPEWNAQLSFDDEHRAFFCSPGCLVAYHADPGHFEEGRSQDAVAGVWVHDYASKELVDGQAASYVLEMDADRIDAPMSRNPVPFAAADDARGYVEQYDDLSTDDVVPLDAFDRDLAEQYRGRFF